MKALILKAPGTNCDFEMKEALDLAGAFTRTAYFFELEKNPEEIHNYTILVFPGGFSYGDYLGSGKVLALLSESLLGEHLNRFVADGKYILGVCNGFQVLIYLGLLPGWNPLEKRQISLTANIKAKFECRWVPLQFVSESVLAINLKSDITNPLKNFELPIAHGEGRFMADHPKTIARLKKEGLVFLRYAGSNPNGSMDSIAGITNSKGNVIGLMPHPERFIHPCQHYDWGHRLQKPWGLYFLRCLVAMAKKHKEKGEAKRLSSSALV